MGCARYFREWHRPVRIVAVDSAGSVTFGGTPGRRMLPGLGMSVCPPLLDASFVDEAVYVEEADTIRACHRLARHGFLFGGSTGTVVSGAMGWLATHDTPDLTAVAIAPDLGERYLETVYQANWVQALYGEDVLEPAGPVAADSRPARTTSPVPPPGPRARHRRQEDEAWAGDPTAGPSRRPSGPWTADPAPLRDAVDGRASETVEEDR
jgi:cysteine synthase A